MAATALSVQSAPHGGLDIAYSTPTQTTGHTAPVGPGVALLVKNGSASPINVDMHVPGTIDGLAVATPSGGAGPARRIAVTNAHDELIPLDAMYGDPANSGLATFDLSAFTTILIACVRVA
jgi:hypothetical protein